jgi:fatty acid-binding protein DegV
VAFVHTHSPERAAQLQARLWRHLPQGSDLPAVDITPVIGAHIGPGAVGVACVASWQPYAVDLAAIMA